MSGAAPFGFGHWRNNVGINQSSMDGTATSYHGAAPVTSFANPRGDFSLTPQYRGGLTDPRIGTTGSAGMARGPGIAPGTLPGGPSAGIGGARTQTARARPKIPGRVL